MDIVVDDQAKSDKDSGQISKARLFLLLQVP
jgi:hypothetical protein